MRKCGADIESPREIPTFPKVNQGPIFELLRRRTTCFPGRSCRTRDRGYFSTDALATTPEHRYTSLNHLLLFLRANFHPIPDNESANFCHAINLLSPTSTLPFLLSQFANRYRLNLNAIIHNRIL